MLIGSQERTVSNFSSEIAREGGPLEVAVTWNIVQQGFFDTYENDDPEAFFPDLPFLAAIGHSAIDPPEYSILIRPRPHQVSMMRQWIIRQRVRQPYLYARFSWKMRSVRIDKQYHGVRMAFQGPAEAVMFRTTFAMP